MCSISIYGNLSMHFICVLYIYSNSDYHLVHCSVRHCVGRCAIEPQWRGVIVVVCYHWIDAVPITSGIFLNSRYTMQMRLNICTYIFMCNTFQVLFSFYTCSLFFVGVSDSNTNCFRFYFLTHRNYLRMLSIIMCKL